MFRMNIRNLEDASFPGENGGVLAYGCLCIRSRGGVCVGIMAVMKT